MNQFTFALVPGRFLRIIVVVSAIFMVKIAYLLHYQEKEEKKKMLTDTFSYSLFINFHPCVPIGELMLSTPTNNTYKIAMASIEHRAIRFFFSSIDSFAWHTIAYPS